VKKITDIITVPLGLFFYLWNERVVKGCILAFQNNRLRRRAKVCGKGSQLIGTGIITGLEKIELGNNVQINENALIRGEGGLTIGDNVHIARNLTIYTHNHNYEGKALPYDDTFIFKEVVIEKNVWIGVNVTILPGAHIEEGAIIGAGSKVAGKVPRLAIYADGKVLKYRNEEHYKQLNNSGSFGGPSGKPL